MSDDAGHTDDALVEALGWLKAERYAFVTPTPATHAGFLARHAAGEARDLRDIFGWNMPFRPETIAPRLLSLLDHGGALERRGELLASRYRVASFADALFLHGAFPTSALDTVFFGPDSYRFAAFLRRSLADARHVTRFVDIGAGAGIGAHAVSMLFPDAACVLTDLNGDALRLAGINARAAGRTVERIETDTLDGLTGAFDLVVANPPYMIDASRRTYRDGGDMHGGGVSLKWTQAALARLSAGGRFLLYTGTAIVNGVDVLSDALRRAAAVHGCTYDFQEIDPDVWGDDLALPCYADVERIAVIGAVMTKPRP